MSEKLQATQVKHINQKTAGVNPKDCIKTEKPVFMVRVYGVIEGIKNFEDRKSGDVKTVFIGEFQAQGPDGKLYESEKLFSFRALEEKLTSTFRSGGEKATEFAYDITALPDDNAVTGYVYSAKAVIPTATSDRLSALAAEIGKTALPGFSVPEEEKAKTAGKGKK